MVEGRRFRRPGSGSWCACPGRSSPSDLVRRGARIAQRARGELLVVHVREGHDRGASWLKDVARLTQDLGGTFDVIDSDEPVDAVLGFAYRQFVTQILVGEPSIGMAGAPPRLVRRRAHPQGHEHRHPRDRAARALIATGGAERCASRLPAGRGTTNDVPARVAIPSRGEPASDASPRSPALRHPRDYAAACRSGQPRRTRPARSTRRSAGLAASNPERFAPGAARSWLRSFTSDQPL